MANESFLAESNVMPMTSTSLWDLLVQSESLVSDSILGTSTSHTTNDSDVYSDSPTRDYRTVTVRDDSQPRMGLERGPGSCRDWQAAQHTLFQLANLCMAISFLTPSSFRFHLLFMRCVLLVAFFFFVLWAGLLICMPDVLGWNLVFFLINGAHVAWLTYHHLPARLPASHTGLYSKVFKPVKVTQADFLALCRRASLQVVNKGGVYAAEGKTPCARHVSVLIRGRLKVTYRRLFLHHVEVNQFVDAAEYDCLCLQQPASDKYQVTITALDDSVVLQWDYQQLQEHLSTNPFIKTVLHYLAGKDVCSQLYAIQEQLMHTPEYMSALTSRQSSMVNVRSCLATHDTCASLSPITDFPGTGFRQLSESSSSATQPTSPNTVETSV